MTTKRVLAVLLAALWTWPAFAGADAPIEVWREKLARKIAAARQQ